MIRQTRCLILSMLAVLLMPASTLFAADHAKISALLNTSALQPGQTAVVAVVVDIDPGLHAQSHTPLDTNYIKFEVVPDPNPAVQFLEPIYPEPKVQFFIGLGKQSVYTGKVVIYLPMRISSSAPAGGINITGKVTFQACNDKVCFQPDSNRPFSLSDKVVGLDAAVSPQNAEIFAGFDQSVFARNAPPVQSPVSSATQIDFFGKSFSLGSTDYALAIFIAFGVGVLFNLMPCVLPVMPLKAMGFFEVSQHNRAKCFYLGLIFSAGVVFIFAVLASIIVLFHSRFNFSWGEQFKYPWFVWSIVGILVIMALGMFGLFEVVLPSAVYNFAPNHESVEGNFLFGMLTAVLSTPCTAPMFAGLLAWSIAQPKILGAATVVTVGIGMAAPYLLLSAFPGLARRVPRTGPWSAVLKQMMGFLILAVAVFFAGGQMASRSVFVWAVFGVIAVAMVFLVVQTAHLSKRAWPMMISAITGVAVVGVSLVIARQFIGGLQWEPFSQAALQSARASGKPVLVEFTANWCGNCLYLEGSVYRDPRTAQAISRDDVRLLRVDLTDQHSPEWHFLDTLNPGGGIPLTAIYGPKHDDPIKLTSVYTTQNLLDALKQATN